MRQQSTRSGLVVLEFTCEVRGCEIEVADERSATPRRQVRKTKGDAALRFRRMEYIEPTIVTRTRAG